MKRYLIFLVSATFFSSLTAMEEKATQQKTDWRPYLILKRSFECQDFKDIKELAALQEKMTYIAYATLQKRYNYLNPFRPIPTEQNANETLK